MNYIQEINAFYNWLITNPIPADAQALWFALMHINNKCGWQKRFTVANTTLLSILGFSRQQLDRMRNVLIQAGRIEYTKRNGRKAGTYRIISFVSNNVTQPETQVLTQPETQTGHNCSTLNKLNKTKLNNNISSSKEEDAKASRGLEEKINNSALIAELVSEYRKVVPKEKWKKGDYSFIGRLYNQAGYDEVLTSINELGYQIDAGFIPEQPLLYLRAILKKENQLQKCLPQSPPPKPQTELIKFEDWQLEAQRRRKEKLAKRSTGNSV